MNPQAKLSICIFSDANFLAINLLENLLSKNCFVNVVTRQAVEWKDNTRHLSMNNLFSIIDKRKFTGEIYCDYAVFCGGFIDSRNVYADYINFISFPNITKAKTIAIFPFECFDRNVVDLIKISSNTSVIFIGDLLGPRINLEGGLLISRSFSEIVWDRKITLPVGEVFYPIFIADAAKTVAKWLFSFGPYGKAVLLLGNRVSGDTFWSANQKLVGQLRLKYDHKLAPRILPKGIETIFVGNNLNFSLTETYRWLQKRIITKPKAPSKNTGFEKVKVKQKLVLPKNLNRIFLFVFVAFAFPFLCLLISVFSSLMAYGSFVSGKEGVAVNSFLFARGLAIFSEKESGVLSYIPGLGLLYKETRFAAVFAGEMNDAGSHTVPVVRDGIKLLENVLGTQIYNPNDFSLRLESEIALVYNDILSMKNLTENASKDNVVLANKILGKIDFERFINLVYHCRILVGEAPQILGQDKSKTYLVLFENNMELRPTGGFIGSFGLVTFDGGRLTDLTVNDVYSADGQLNGHVEPPPPIKDYLGEANWWLRDSNWDPDFPTSAKRAEWFLDKELSKQVDGVVSTDLFPVKGILKSMGPIFLSDYNLNITSDNLYEETQSEVQSNFFPGAHKKASFLTALSRNLLGGIINLKINQKLGILKTFYEGLDGRHIQIYLHDNSQQNAVSALEWDGAVTSPTCGSNCYADLVGVVEANVGDNKANYFIQRSMNLNLTVGPSGVDHMLTLDLVNTANPALGPSGKYKDYIRIIIPSDTSLVSVRSDNGNTQENLSPEITEIRGHKEVGVLVEVLAGSNKNIEFSWVSKTDGGSLLTSYGLYVRKQAGIDADKISINIKGNGVAFEADPRFTLTKSGTYLYNTTLARDIFSRFSW